MNLAKTPAPCGYQPIEYQYSTIAGLIHVKNSDWKKFILSRISAPTARTPTQSSRLPCRILAPHIEFLRFFMYNLPIERNTFFIDPDVSMLEAMLEDARSKVMAFTQKLFTYRKPANTDF